MRKIIVLLALAAFVSGCATTKVKPLVPTAPQNALKSSYRKTQEVILVSCDDNVSGQSYQVVNSGKARKLTNSIETTSVVETTDTGERFVMHGCYGKVGDRFKVAF